MSHTSTLTSKNQTTIPKAVVAALKISPSAILTYEIEPDGSVRLTAKTATFAGLAASFGKKKSLKSFTVEQMSSSVRSEAGKRFKKAFQ